MSRAFRNEIDQFRLAFTCEDCRHGVDGQDGAPLACDLLYDPTPHRRATIDAMAEGDALMFCKMFEAR